ncbi:phosphoglucosamine mutase [Alphaproteobacteria bacterium]|nr:phosphoglucosamine mutase [Alphaproteobacteria bacterium]GHS95606.1 phosphoglucosamine mutase [Alphaproteobacteria bacterium]
MKKLFGTDGIRGRANEGVIIPERLVKIGRAVAYYFQRHGRPAPEAAPPFESPYRPFNPYVRDSIVSHPFTVVMGKDTRLSGYMIESALVAGLVAQGAHVIMLGPAPTPAVALLTRSLRADVGIMISASHNPYYDNGIKFFDATGTKFTEEVEQKIEEILQADAFPPSAECGKSMRLDDAVGRYVEFAKATFPKGRTLDGLKIVLDCANGAAYKVAPRVFWELGACVVPIADAPNGRNINENCGALHPENLFSHLQTSQADVGLSLDGDADRLVLMTPKGNIVNGDQILALLAGKMHKEGTLRGGVVSTNMSNLGLKMHLKTLEIPHFVAPVGDKNVLKMMQQTGSNLGGEESGHILLSDANTTGDGIIAALHVLGILGENKQALDEVFPVFQPVPQIVRNFPLGRGITDEQLRVLREKALDFLGEQSDVVIRKSGTEPVLRIMIQSIDASLLETFFEEISTVFFAA